MLILSACSSKSEVPSTPFTPSAALLATSTFTQTANTNTPTPQNSASNTPQIPYQNYYASVIPGKYLACQIYDPNSSFVYKLNLIDVANGAVSSLLDGVPVSTITSDGKYLVFGNENDRHYYLHDLVQDKVQEIGGPGSYKYPEYDYPEISPNGLEILLTHLSRGLIVWSIADNRLLFQADILPDTNDLTIQQISRSMDGNKFAFYTRYVRGPKPIEGLYVIDKSCLSSPEKCLSDTNKLVSEPYGSAPITWMSNGNLAVADWSKNSGANINVYDIPNKRSVVKTIKLNPADGQIVSLFWSPDNTSIAIQQFNSNYITLLSINGTIENKIDGCSGQLLGWVIINK